MTALKFLLAAFVVCFLAGVLIAAGVSPIYCVGGAFGLGSTFGEEIK